MKRTLKGEHHFSASLKDIRRTTTKMRQISFYLQSFVRISSSFSRVTLVFAPVSSNFMWRSHMMRFAFIIAEHRRCWWWWWRWWCSYESDCVCTTKTHWIRPTSCDHNKLSLSPRLAFKKKEREAKNGTERMQSTVWTWWTIYRSFIYWAFFKMYHHALALFFSSRTMKTGK